MCDGIPYSLYVLYHQFILLTPDVNSDWLNFHASKQLHFQACLTVIPQLLHIKGP